MALVDKLSGRSVKMKTKYQIGDEVYYKRFIESLGSIPSEYIVRKGTVISIRVSSSDGTPRYGVETLRGGIVSFVLSEDEIYSTQKDVLASIK